MKSIPADEQAEVEFKGVKKVGFMSASFALFSILRVYTREGKSMKNKPIHVSTRGKPNLQALSTQERKMFLKTLLAHVVKSTNN